ncbi:5'/3'-nucleotidase SurE [Thermodesulfatator autotrophicus]|uniref:5'-nucleotidase SurE n=1 Tax=Thermodesulfatator autotrophicus TaxID=1795632 RepID=A0A177EC69_9BACT|nr:5'/3'-nucleotidase SurE [Thermodesulfatator autotrophicus]OAG28762.1 5'/3'-nucleotidase SurE [Thermodesulfatator autotrophicus]
MRILLTNDDGIFAEGLCALYDALCNQHEIFVVAPEAERSAVGHAITIADPLRVKKVKRGNIFFGYAVSGTPADCVKIALKEIIHSPIDLVLSGINRGANVGINVLYSGTVSAATEGAILGYPSIAVSLDEYKEPDYCFAAYFVSCLLDFLKGNKIKSNFCLNINIPFLPAHKIKGIKFVPQSTKPLIERFEKRIDPHGNLYYWQCSEEFTEKDPNTDVVALKEGYITITPLFHNLTRFELLNKISSWNIPF